jgi:hypothetical protein
MFCYRILTLFFSVIPSYYRTFRTLCDISGTTENIDRNHKAVVRYCCSQFHNNQSLAAYNRPIVAINMDIQMSVLFTS